ncbi:hypothetical protein TNCV_3758441 [Trichonephila clavipes]|nr:hypothetical protein TNCV_3758441 [Trichonephila clavipes]
MNSDFDEEIDNETPIKTVTFPNVLHCLKTVKTYLSLMQLNFWLSENTDVGFPGNERAHQKVKQGAESSQHAVPLTLREYYIHIH